MTGQRQSEPFTALGLTNKEIEEKEGNSSMYQKDLCWCMCYLAHKVPGWCFCSLDRGKREEFMSMSNALLREERWQIEAEEEEKKRKKKAKGGRRVLPSENTSPHLRQSDKKIVKPRLSPRTPVLEERLIEIKKETFSSLLKEKEVSSSPELHMELQGEGESPTLNAKRKLEEDFSKAVENDEDSEKNLNKRAEEKKSLKRKRRKRQKKMPWHSWLCKDCGKKLPDGHMNCMGEILRQFDNSMKYGPCIGITRMERWLRASHLGLNPPENVIKALCTSQNLEIINACLWEGQAF